VRARRPRRGGADRDEPSRVVVFGDLLSAEECSELIELARKRLSRSETVATRTGASEVNEARTSDGMFFTPAEFPVCARLEARLAELLDWPLENGEGLQILRYRPGAEYKPHYDYFDPAEPGTPAILKRGGQRLASIVCYLNTPEAGGATVFPKAGIEVAPVRGNAVFFSYDRPPSLHPHPARRRPGRRRGEVGRDQMDAGGPVRVAVPTAAPTKPAAWNNPACVSTAAHRRRCLAEQSARYSDPPGKTHA
jgi:hypothetical protein